MKTYLVALGANQSTYRHTPVKILKRSLRLFVRESLFPVSISPWYQTEAFPKGSGPDFVNGAVKVKTSLGENAALDALHRIENELGRERKERWGPRVCDLDLLSSGDAVLPDRETVVAWMNLPLEAQKTQAPETLLLPHPRLHERAFVLIPMAAIAGDWVHPILQKTVAQMVEALPPKDVAAMKRILEPEEILGAVFPEGLPTPASGLPD